MALTEGIGSPPRRKSLRAQKPAGAFKDDLPKEVLAMTGMVEEEQKMPEGWNPSDDSEDDYTPVQVKRKGRRRRKIDSDSDSEEEEFREKKMKVSHGRRRNASKALPARVKSEKKRSLSENCVICRKEVQGPFATGLFSIGTANMKFHLAAEHYFPEGGFRDVVRAAPEDIGPGDLLPNDLVGSMYKYTCHLQPCTKRKQGYKEIVLHLATQHHRLKEVMLVDKRPGVAEAVASLYPAEEEKPLPSVKQEEEKRVGPKESEDTEDDVDNPTAVVGTCNPSSGTKLTSAEQVHGQIEVGKSDPRFNKVHNCLLCETRDGKNLNFGSGLSELRNHYSVCFYNLGHFKGVLDPGVDNKDSEGKVVDEYGRKFRYKCPATNCPRNQARAKPCGFKEWVIHAGVAHHLVERVMEVVAEKNEPMKEVLEATREARIASGIIVVEKLVDPYVEEIHNCLLCAGKDRDGINLSLDPTKLWAIRYHYASCYFDTGVYLQLGGDYLPGEQNSNPDGTGRDMLGREVRYRCIEEGCLMKRQVGYKELCIHMASEHGGLEEVMAKDSREEIRNLVLKIKKRK